MTPLIKNLPAAHSPGDHSAPSWTQTLHAHPTQVMERGRHDFDFLQEPRDDVAQERHCGFGKCASKVIPDTCRSLTVANFKLTIRQSNVTMRHWSALLMKQQQVWMWNLSQNHWGCCTALLSLLLSFWTFRCQDIVPGWQADKRTWQALSLSVQFRQFATDLHKLFAK